MVLGELVTDPAKLYNPYEWTALQTKIRSRYTMEMERKMFDSLVGGASISEVLKLAKEQDRANDNQEGEIELF